MSQVWVLTPGPHTNTHTHTHTHRGGWWSHIIPSSSSPSSSAAPQLSILKPSVGLIYVLMCQPGPARVRLCSLPDSIFLFFFSLSGLYHCTHALVSADSVIIQSVITLLVVLIVPADSETILLLRKTAGKMENERSLFGRKMYFTAAEGNVPLEAFRFLFFLFFFTETKHQQHIKLPG